MNADELEVLVVTLLKDEFLNSDIIERSADKIIEKVGSNDKDKRKQVGDLKKQISEISGKLSNLSKFIEDGFPSVTIRDRITSLERERALIEQTIIEIETRSDMKIDRYELIQRMKKDSDELFNEPDKLRDVIKKYITKIVISDSQAEITSFGDVVSSEASGRGI